MLRVPPQGPLKGHDVGHRSAGADPERGVKGDDPVVMKAPGEFPMMRNDESQGVGEGERDVRHSMQLLSHLFPFVRVGVEGVTD